jgi:sulfur-carrier protein adenylyltransferase/sulfurtransferase
MKQMSVDTLHDLMRKGEVELLLLDIREPYERRICKLPGSVFVPMREALHNPGKIPMDVKTIVYCHHGIRSFILIKKLESDYGYDNLINLNGGIHRWAELMDPEMQQY